MLQNLNVYPAALKAHMCAEWAYAVARDRFTPIRRDRLSPNITYMNYPVIYNSFII